MLCCFLIDLHFRDKMRLNRAIIAYKKADPTWKDAIHTMPLHTNNTQNSDNNHKKEEIKIKNNDDNNDNNNDNENDSEMYENDNDNDPQIVMSDENNIEMPKIPPVIGDIVTDGRHAKKTSEEGAV